MSEKVRRVRLLLAVCAAGMLAIVVPWPSSGAVTEPPPLYLARERGAGGVAPEAGTFVAVADSARLVAHLLADGVNIADLEVIDSTGRVVDLRPNGQAEPTGAAFEPVAVQMWLRASFTVRWQGLDGRLRGDSPDNICWGTKQSVRDRLNLPTHQGGRELTLAETLAEADTRLTAMHQPGYQIPSRCFHRSVPTSHRAGYLHNLWHRLTGTSAGSS